MERFSIHELPGAQGVRDRKVFPFVHVLAVAKQMLRSRTLPIYHSRMIV